MNNLINDIFKDNPRKRVRRMGNERVPKGTEQHKYKITTRRIHPQIASKPQRAHFQHSEEGMGYHTAGEGAVDGDSMKSDPLSLQ